VHRIQRDENILTTKLNTNHDKVMDMVKVLSNNFFSVSRAPVVNDQVSGRTDGNLVSNVARKYELSVIPTNFNLDDVSSEK
jgi:hypothetical protein